MRASKPRTIGVEVVGDVAAEVGESPVWDPREQRLLWVDIFRGEVHALSPNGRGDVRAKFDGSVGFVALASDGGLLAGTRDGFGTVADGRFTLRVPVELDRRDRRMNDGNCDRQGRLWGGTMSDAKRVGGRLYRVDPGWKVTAVQLDLRVPNGLAWSAAGDVMYITDSEAGVGIWRFDPDEGVPRERIGLVEIDDGLGDADGIAIDEEDCIWVALWGGARVRRYSPRGRLLREIAVPATHVTSCAFGGGDYGDLFITTARYGLTPETLALEPHAGAVFCCQPGVRGRTPDAYAG